LNSASESQPGRTFATRSLKRHSSAVRIHVLRVPRNHEEENMSKKDFDKHYRNHDNSSQAGKKAVLDGPTRNSVPVIFAAIAALVLALGAWLLFMNGQADEEASSQAGYRASEVIHDVSQFEDGKARHFAYDSGDGVSIRYFVLKSSDGIHRAAFDACDVCWPAGKGYFQDGDHMVCRNCGRRFASVRINEVKGGCNPAPLKRALVDGKLVINVNDIMRGRSYFDFSKRG
jgi:uncharacterized membrane protein